MLALINHVLDLSRIEAGKLHLEAIDFDLRVLIERVVGTFAEAAESKNLELTSIVDADVPMLVNADSVRLRQILINLINNAIKFTQEGEVALSVKCESQSEAEAALRFEVRDTGIGIAEETQARLFSAFVQADGSTARTFGGSGLGLALSKKLVEGMGGKIGVESRPGAGSTFWFTLNVHKQTSAGSIDQARRDLPGLKVLVVDDQATNREALISQLASFHMATIEADTFAAALSALRQAAGRGTPFDLALIDGQIQGRQGLELARAIGADKEIAQVRLILISTYGQRASEQMLREAGVCASLMKPRPPARASSE